MRVYFLTLHTNNLPETGKRQYENKGTRAPPDAMASIGERHEKQKIFAAIFPPNEMPVLFPVRRNIEKSTQAA
jgi:hypothetical protein